MNIASFAVRIDHYKLERACRFASTLCGVCGLLRIKRLRLSGSNELPRAPTGSRWLMEALAGPSQWEHSMMLSNAVQGAFSKAVGAQGIVQTVLTC